MLDYLLKVLTFNLALHFSVPGCFQIAFSIYADTYSNIFICLETAVE
jgi:hypothetical protein